MTAAAARADCSNFNPDGTCAGVVIRDNLTLAMDRELTGKRCLLASGARCHYFDECVAPGLQSRRAREVARQQARRTRYLPSDATRRENVSLDMDLRDGPLFSAGGPGP